jgi:hypothetical protein
MLMNVYAKLVSVEKAELLLALNVQRGLSNLPLEQETALVRLDIIFMANLASNVPRTHTRHRQEI